MPPFSQRSKTIEQRISQLESGQLSKGLQGVCSKTLTLMVACGETLRMASPAPSARSEAERALVALSLEQLQNGIEAVSVVATRGELGVALSDAFEAAFADSGDERALFVESAMAGLFARDQLASVVAAAHARASLGSDGEPDRQSVRAALTGLEAKLAELDRELAGRARTLSGINSERRVARDKLAPEQRAAAWWFSARSEAGDDGLLAALAELPSAAVDGTPRAALGEAARADIDRCQLPDLRADDAASGLRRVALGSAHSAERAWLSARAEGDGVLAAALSLAADPALEAE